MAHAPFMPQAAVIAQTSFTAPVPHGAMPPVSHTAAMQHAASMKHAAAMQHTAAMTHAARGTSVPPMAHAAMHTSIAVSSSGYELPHRSSPARVGCGGMASTHAAAPPLPALPSAPLPPPVGMPTPEPSGVMPQGLSSPTAGNRPPPPAQPAELLTTQPRMHKQHKQPTEQPIEQPSSPQVTEQPIKHDTEHEAEHDAEDDSELEAIPCLRNLPEELVLDIASRSPLRAFRALLGLDGLI